MNLSEYSVRRPITLLMITLSVFVLGYLSLGRLPLTLLPEYESTSLYIMVNYPSSSPEEVERNITRYLEEAFSTLNGLNSMRSNSNGNGANVRLEFVPGTDMDIASLEIRDRIDQVKGLLPDDVDRVYLRTFDTSNLPVFRFAIAWEGERDGLATFFEEILRRRLERVEGVANVDARGLDTREIIIDLNESLLEAHGVELNNLRNVLRTNNISYSGGYILEGQRKFTVRTVGELTSIDDIVDLPLQGGRIKLSDVATVRYDFPVKNQFAHLNRMDAVTVMVYKASTANVVAACQSIRAELEAIQADPEYSDNLTVQIFSDQSEQILKSLNDLKTAGIYGGCLAIFVLFMFLLKFRSTLIIGLAIPVSVVFTFAFMFLLRVFAGSQITLNVISLMGLMVAIGMLVDNSVVVLENIFRYRQDKGLSARDAAIRGSREVGVAVTASTATTVVVFASVIFLQNSFAGRFTADFGTAVAISLVASLIVAVTLVPMISSRLFTGKERPRQKVFVLLNHTYGRLMRVLLRWRFVALLLMAGVGYSSYVLLTDIDRQGMAGAAERMVGLQVFVERSFSIQEMEQVYDQIEKIILDNQEELEVVSVSSSYRSRGSSQGRYRGEMNVFLAEDGETTLTTEIKDKMLALIPDLPGVEIRSGRMRRMGGGGEMGVEVELRGDEAEILAIYSEEIKNVLMNIDGVLDVQTDLETGDDEIHISVDRQKIEKLGLSSMDVARTINSALSTRAATRLKGSSGEIDVILQLRGGNEISLEELLNLSISNRGGELVPMHSVVSYSYSKGPVGIERNDRKASLEIVADVGEGGTFFVSQDIQNAMADFGLPPGYTWRMGRSYREARESEEQSLFAVILALVLMYIIMAALFENFLHPFTILFTVPFSIIGVALIFNYTNTSMSQNAYLGIMILFGIVVNNGIILIDHINLLRRSGMKRDDAIVQGGMDRLRPILMTACTSLFGLLPLTLPFLISDDLSSLLSGGGGGGRGGGGGGGGRGGGGPGMMGGASSMWAPVSLAVFGGLTTSTFLTLIILPSIYSYMDDVTRVFMWCLRRLSRRKNVELEASTEPVLVGDKA